MSPPPAGYRVASADAQTGPWKNRLARSTSPYLLQHADNPVDWYEWGDAAFELARSTGRPIFLSVGYTACHWCHVMERESFEDPAVAAYMNEHFVNVKVDREERPDVDALYMDAMHAMGQAGGWPASYWLTHDLLPFYAGTYFPPTWRYGTPGFRDLLTSLASSWQNTPEGQIQRAEKIRGALADAAQIKRAASPADAAELERGMEDLDEHWDSRSAGWGGGAKFPMCPNGELLLAAGVVGGDRGALEKIESLLDAIDRGGIHDHLGGGFHRYAVDPSWEVPHFEKMLYDNAQLLRLYAEAAIALEAPRFRLAAEGIVGWLAREMRHGSGAFYASQDADSEDLGGHHEEGAFYVWTREELRRILGPGPARRFESAYRVREWGNFERGTTVLNRAAGVDPAEPALLRARTKLLAVRAGRPAPETDTKRVVAWNGLAVGGLSRAGRLLGESDWIELARGAAEALLAALGEGGSLPRTLEPAAPAGVLADYAFTAEGLLDLYEADLAPRWLLAARDIAVSAVGRFQDPETGLLFQAELSDRSLPARRLALTEGAEPSGAGRLLEVLRRLEIYGAPGVDPAWSERSLRALAGHIQDEPGGHPSLLAQLLLRGGGVELVVSAPDRESAAPFLALWRSAWRPRGVAGLLTPATAPALEGFTSFRNRAPRGIARAFLCQDRSCGLPATSPEALARQLARL